MVCFQGFLNSSIIQKWCNPLIWRLKHLQSLQSAQPHSTSMALGYCVCVHVCMFMCVCVLHGSSIRGARLFQLKVPGFFVWYVNMIQWWLSLCACMCVCVVFFDMCIYSACEPHARCMHVFVYMWYVCMVCVVWGYIVSVHTSHTYTDLHTHKKSYLYTPYT